MVVFSMSEEVEKEIALKTHRCRPQPFSLTGTLPYRGSWRPLPRSDLLPQHGQNAADAVIHAACRPTRSKSRNESLPSRRLAGVEWHLARGIADGLRRNQPIPPRPLESSRTAIGLNPPSSGYESSYRASPEWTQTATPIRPKQAVTSAIVLCAVVRPHLSSSDTGSLHCMASR